MQGRHLQSAGHVVTQHVCYALCNGDVRLLPLVSDISPLCWRSVQRRLHAHM